MFRILSACILSIALLTAPASATGYLRDEGTNVGPYGYFDCVGPSITCTKTGVVASATVGDSSGNLRTAECYYWGAGASTSTSMCFNSSLNTMTLTVEGTVVRVWSTVSGGSMLLAGGIDFLILDNTNEANGQLVFGAQ